MKTREKVAISRLRRDASEETSSAHTPISDLRSPELGEDKCVSFKPLTLCYFVRAPEQMNTGAIPCLYWLLGGVSPLEEQSVITHTELKEKESPRFPTKISPKFLFLFTVNLYLLLLLLTRIYHSLGTPVIFVLSLKFILLRFLVLVVF